MPAASAVSRARILSPSRRIVSAFGPTYTSPHDSVASTNSALSDKNPYPGWSASQLLISAADKTRETFR